MKHTLEEKIAKITELAKDRSRLQEELARIEQSIESFFSNGSANYAADRNPPKKRKCGKCGQAGHRIEKCGKKREPQFGESDPDTLPPATSL